MNLRLLESFLKTAIEENDSTGALDMLIRIYLDSCINDYLNVNNVRGDVNGLELVGSAIQHALNTIEYTKSWTMKFDPSSRSIKIDLE